MKFLLVFLIIISSFWASAQIPNHFVLGEEQFSKIDIYDVYEDSTHPLHVATNDGLYVFNQNKFILIPRNEVQRGSSFFDFKTNKKGELFCKNLNGQLFILSKNEITLYHQLTSESNGKFHYFFDELDQLHILSGSFYKINQHGKKETIIAPKQSSENWIRHFVNPSFNYDGTVFCKYGQKDSINYMMYKQGEVSYLPVDGVKWKNNNQHQSLSKKMYFSRLEDAIILIGKDSVVGTYAPSLAINFDPSFYETIKSVGPNLLIGMHRSNGFRFIYKEKNEIHATPYYLPNTFISAAYLNHKGTLFLGTFNKGVIVIPNYKAVAEVSTNQFSGIATTPDNDVFLSTRDGKLFEYTNKLTLKKQVTLQYDKLFYVEYPYFLSSTEPTHVIPDFIENTPSIKDVYEAEIGLFLATNSGICFLPKIDGIIPAFLNTSAHNISIKSSEKFKTVAYNNASNTLYFANFKGTFSVSSTGEEKKVLFQGADIMSNDIEIHDHKLIFGTENKGIIFYKNGTKKQLNSTSGLLSDRIVKLKIQGDYLYALFNNGIQLIHLKTFKITNLGLEEGIRNKQIINFDVSNDRLWITENDRFYSLKIEDIIQPQLPQLAFTLDSIVVNNLVIDTLQQTSFDHTENAFKIYVDFKDIPKMNEAQFAYKLIGFDAEFKHLPTSLNYIEYQSLPPGKYTLQVKLTYRDSESEIYQYQFKILPPFWQRWWFYILILTILGGITFIIFRYKLKRQAEEAKRINELNASKMMAIQSQMNPHFVFNALNSIQHLVMKGDKDQSYEYITSFSNLVRRTLDYSEKETISLREEIQLLEVYLSLEQLRFREDFEYQLNYTEIPNIQVPPMLIQPFIENALVHGLIHKKGKKILTINFKIEDVLICTVEDNGIGRTAATAIKARQMDNHKSFAVNSIDNRFAILRTYYDHSIGYSYEDFLPDNTTNVVTRLTLRIPYKSKKEA